MKARHLGTLLSVVAAFVWLAPYVWMVTTSLRPLGDILAHPTALVPEHVTTAAYGEVFQTLDVPRTLAVTTAMAATIALVQILFALPAGYVLAKLQFRGRALLAALVLGCLLVPAQVTFVPVFAMLAKVRLVNTFAGLVLPFAASAFGTFMVQKSLSYVPDDLIEAARLDGAGELTIVYRILGPILRPTLVSLFLLSFVFHWNDYFWPLVMTTDDRVRTLPLAVALFREQGTGVRWHLVMAANVVLSVPALLLFVMAQKQLFRAVGARG